MNELKPARRIAALYDGDLYAWAYDQAARLRHLKPEGLDWENVAEEIESLGKSDRRALGSNLNVILKHLIKWAFQPARRKQGWLDSIEEHRDRFDRIIADSPGLVAVLAQILDAEYSKARKSALRETRLPANAVPVRCPFSAKQALDDDFLL